MTAELDTLVDSVLAATGSNLDDGDLVTLLWEADLRHLDVDYVPAEGDVGSGPLQSPRRRARPRSCRGPMRPTPQPRR